MVRQNAKKNTSGTSTTSSPAERDKRLQLAGALLFDLEQLNNRLNDIQPEMKSIEQIVVTRFKQALEDESMSITKTIMLHSRMSYSIALLVRTKIDLYDRVSGNVGLYESNEEIPHEIIPPEENRGLVLDFKQRREAEKICMAAVQLSIENKDVTREAVDERASQIVEEKDDGP